MAKTVTTQLASSIYVYSCSLSYCILKSKLEKKHFKLQKVNSYSVGFGKCLVDGREGGIFSSVALLMHYIHIINLLILLTANFETYVLAPIVHSWHDPHESHF